MFWYDKEIGRKVYFNYIVFLKPYHQHQIDTLFFTLLFFHRKEESKNKETKEGHIFTLGCAALFRMKPVVLGKKWSHDNLIHSRYEAVYYLQTGFEGVKKQLCGEENLDKALRP